MQFFDRSARVTLRRRDSQALRIQALRISFEIRKDLRSSVNTLELRIRNLSEATRGSFIARNNQVLVEAGYQGQRELLFVGDISDIEDKPVDFGSLDRVTVLHSGDGASALREREFSMCHDAGEGATAQDAFDHCAHALGLPLGEVRGLEGQSYPRGFSTVGLVRDALDRLALAFGVHWMVHDGVLEVLPRNGTSDEDVVVLSKHSGLIGVPTRTEAGFSIRALLNARLRPGRRVRLRSERAQGTFKILAVAHRGDTQGDSWYSEMEVAHLTAEANPAQEDASPATTEPENEEAPS